MEGRGSPAATYAFDEEEHETKAPLRLWLRLFSCTNLIESEIARRLRANFDISLAKFDFLAQLYRSPGQTMTMSDLGKNLMVTGGNITGLTDRLAREGLVVRRAHPSDRRSRVIGLSAKGKAMFETMADAHETWIGDLMSGLDDEQRDVMMEHLAALKMAVQQMPEKEGT